MPRERVSIGRGRRYRTKMCTKFVRGIYYSLPIAYPLRFPFGRILEDVEAIGEK